MNLYRKQRFCEAFKHDHIVHYVDVIPHDLNSNMLAVCTVMKYCDRGDLAEHLKALRSNQQPYVG